MVATEADGARRPSRSLLDSKGLEAPISAAMWNIVRVLLFALAVAGFIGQSSAHATPVQVFEATAAMPEADCAEMMDMADEAVDDAEGPCSKMTPDCIAKMGCAAVASPMPPAPAIEHPLGSGAKSFAEVDVALEGAGPLPLKSPPKPLS